MEQNNKFNKNRAFTLIEVSVAVFFITVGVLGAFTLIEQVVSYTSVSSSYLVTNYLSQEGIEIVRNIRDTNWLEGEAWDNGITCSLPPCFFEADYTDQSLSSYLDRYLYINGNNSFYTYIDSPLPGDTKTKFKRKIIITPQESDILKVSVQVKWQERGKDHQVTAQENLYNWW
ncbi:hypothetical protein ACFL0A_01280 [Patescibacteria group bacterium]